MAEDKPTQLPSQQYGIPEPVDTDADLSATQAQIDVYYANALADPNHPYNSKRNPLYSHYANRIKGLHEHKANLQELEPSDYDIAVQELADKNRVKQEKRHAAACADLKAYVKAGGREDFIISEDISPELAKCVTMMKLNQQGKQNELTSLLQSSYRKLKIDAGLMQEYQNIILSETISKKVKQNFVESFLLELLVKNKPKEQ